MRTKTIYICEECGNEFEHSSDAAKCESQHYGLSVEEYYTWKNLKEHVKRSGYSIGITKNAETERYFDEAIQELTKFECQHQLNINC